MARAKARVDLTGKTVLIIRSPHDEAQPGDLEMASSLHAATDVCVLLLPRGYEFDALSDAQLAAINLQRIKNGPEDS